MSTGCQKDRKTGRQTYRQIERQRLFSLVVKTKVVQNVNRMSKTQTGRKIYSAPDRKSDGETDQG